MLVKTELIHMLFELWRGIQYTCSYLSKEGQENVVMGTDRKTVREEWKLWMG